MTFSFVIPIFNEAETIHELLARLNSLLSRIQEPWEVIFVNDGSRDQSLELLKDQVDTDNRFKILSFSRNFGHQIAITAGMDHSSGDAVIIMDADLQDPPEVVLSLIQKWREGYHVVYAVRTSRAGETWFKKISADLYYKLLSFLSHIDIPRNTGDFRLVDRKALNAFLSMRESHRFVRGMFTWVGFRQIGVEFERAERFAGETKYPLRKMLKLAFDGILSFSFVPLRLVMNLGLMISLAAMAFACYALFSYLRGNTIPGWTSVAVLIAFIGGVQLLVMGMLGEYIGRIHEETKMRPLYIVQEALGFSSAVTPAKRTVVAGGLQTFPENV